MPRLNWADIHLRYRGEHIEGRNMPLDDVVVTLDAVDGHIACIRSASASAKAACWGI